jgi:hypothetical protein
MIITRLIRLSALIAAIATAPTCYAALESDNSSALETLKGLPVVTPDNQGLPAITATLTPSRVTLEVPNEPHLLVLQASALTSASPVHYRDIIEQSLRARGTVVLQDSCLARGEYGRFDESNGDARARGA